MLILIPVSKADYKLGLPLAEHMKFLGGLQRHDIVLFPAGSRAVSTVKKMSEILDTVAHSVRVVPLENTNETGWPVSANVTFRKVMEWTDKSGYEGPAYFFEMDNVPLRSTWADDLQDEYLRQRKLCVGVLEDTVWTNPDGSKRIRGKHMVGTGIYTIPMRAYSVLLRSCGSVATPFDVFLCNEVVPVAAHTALIQHNWSTCNYRREGKAIVCDTDPVRPNNPYFAKPVRANAAVLHGCKDGSLIKLFDAGGGSEPTAPQKRNKATAVAANNQQPAEPIEPRNNE